ncbi:MAG: hypothetical protein NVS2B6_07910 [Thermoleophilaceae bacterium]
MVRGGGVWFVPLGGRGGPGAVGVGPARGGLVRGGGVRFLRLAGRGGPGAVGVGPARGGLVRDPGVWFVRLAGPGGPGAAAGGPARCGLVRGRGVRFAPTGGAVEHLGRLSVGLLRDVLFGGQRKLKAPARDRLFAITTAQVTLEAQLGLRHRPAAGIVFQSVPTADFKSIVADAEELLQGAAKDTGTSVETADDEFGYRWVVLRNEEFEDLVVSINLVATELEASGYGDRLLAAVFPFEEEGRPIYFIYNFKRGAYYPFVPAPGEHERNNEREFQLKAQIASDLPFEPELARWFPLWEIPL